VVRCLGTGKRLVAGLLVAVGLWAEENGWGEAGRTAGAEGKGRAGWEGVMGMMGSVGWAGLASVSGGILRLAGLAGKAVGLAEAGECVGGGGASEGEAVGAVEGRKGRDSMGDAEISRGVRLGLLSVRVVLSVGH
jgi:hypothetical protein